MSLSFDTPVDIAANNEVLGIFYSSIVDNPYLKDEHKVRALDMVVMRYVHDMTYKEIGAEYSVSKSRTAQIIAKATRIMRLKLHYIEKNGR